MVVDRKNYIKHHYGIENPTDINKEEAIINA